MGSLIQHGRDPSGQCYRRNRYYDAASGRFTQEDPIGLAGGLNVYGYANGDPVSFSDPFGLCAVAGDTIPEIGQCAVQPAHLGPEASGRLEDPGLLDPVAWAAGGLAGGLRALGARFFGRTAATEAAATGATRAFASLGSGTIERPDMLIQVTTVGRTLKVHEVAYYPGREVTHAEMRAAFRAFQNEVRERGYDFVDLMYHRTKNGVVKTRTIDLRN